MQVFASSFVIVRIILFTRQLMPLHDQIICLKEENSINHEEEGKNLDTVYKEKIISSQQRFLSPGFS